MTTLNFEFIIIISFITAIALIVGDWKENRTNKSYNEPVRKAVARAKVMPRSTHQSEESINA